MSYRVDLLVSILSVIFLPLLINLGLVLQKLAHPRLLEVTSDLVQRADRWWAGLESGVWGDGEPPKRQNRGMSGC